MKKNVYFYNHQITFDEIDMYGKIKISQLMRHTQQSAGDHFLDIGYSYEFLKENNIIFVLSKYKIQITRFPMYKEKIKIKTSYLGAVGPVFARYFEIFDENDEIIAKAYSHWPIIDPTTRQLIRPSKFPFELPIEDIKFDDIDEMTTISEPHNMTFKFSRYVGYSGIDCNYHYNNANYTDIICDTIPELINGKEIKEFEINYVKEAVFGDIINVYEKNGIVIGKVNDKISFKARVII